MAKKIDPDEWIRLQTAAKRRGVSRQAIENLVNRGKLETVLIDELQFVRIEDVENYTPDSRGRPRKVETKKKRVQR
jgi:hypothetical protein